LQSREGRGRRTVQYNPKGAVSFEQWSEAIATLARRGLCGGAVLMPDDDEFEDDEEEDDFSDDQDEEDDEDED
jgi:hypothetical protein